MTPSTKKHLARFRHAFKAAHLSTCGNYRYSLTRRWDETRPTVAFVMLNPSTADHTEDDPTIRRCMRFADDWGYGSLIVGNLFAIRGPDPAVIKMIVDPVGSDNDNYLDSITAGAKEVVCAWGNHGKYMGRDEVVCDALKNRKLVSLKRGKDGSPGHPLYIRADAERVPFFGRTLP